MKHPRALSALIVAVTLASPACGSDERASPPTATGTTFEVSMTENKFTPSSFEVEEGQEVTFLFTNDGTVDHEAILGTEAEQVDHEADMRGTGSDGGDLHGDEDDATDDMDDMDGMGHRGSSDDAVVVKPGDTARLTETFEDTGLVILGCHEPGHYEAGMKATITVS